jgi:hypothetical protein
VQELGQCPVDPDGGLRVVVDGGLDEKDPGECEDDHPREMPDEPDPSDPGPDQRSHLLGLRVGEKVLRDAPVALVEADTDQDQSRRTHDPGAGGPAEDAGRRLVGTCRSLRGAGENADGDDAHSEVDEAAGERGDPIDPAVRPLGATPDRGADESPERIAAETDGNERQQDLAEGLVGDGVESALLVRELAAVPDRELERQDSDDGVDQSTRDESRTREPFESTRPDETLTSGPGRVHCTAVRGVGHLVSPLLSACARVSRPGVHAP